MENGNFGQALEILKGGGKVARRGWNGEGMHLELQVPDDDSKMKQSYIFINPVGGQLVPWVASQSDMLGEDWYEVQ